MCEGEYLRNAEGDEVTQGHRHTDTVQVNVRSAGVILGLELSCYDFVCVGYAHSMSGLVCGPVDVYASS
jgi:hypothetical protein